MIVWRLTTNACTIENDICCLFIKIWMKKTQAFDLKTFLPKVNNSPYYNYKVRHRHHLGLFKPAHLPRFSVSNSWKKLLTDIFVSNILLLCLYIFVHAPSVWFDDINFFLLKIMFQIQSTASQINISLKRVAESLWKYVNDSFIDLFDSRVKENLL